jgi:hypothetical protein
MEHFRAFRTRREELQKDPEQVEAVLADGAGKAGRIAAETLCRARQAVGLE